MTHAERRFEFACWYHTFEMIQRYLMCNTAGRLDGAEKALRHRELCEFYVGVFMGCDNTERVAFYHSAELERLHRATQEMLTDCMDEAIDFPVNNPHPDYDRLGRRFFQRFHAIACRTLGDAT